MLNRVQLIGHLGTDPEVRYTGTGTPVANFSLATTERWTDKSGKKQERTEWHRIVVWGTQGENCGTYLRKGRQVFVDGKIQTREWEDTNNGQRRFRTEIIAQDVMFLGSAPAEQSQGEQMGRQQ